jgi:hypothetical protein
MLSYDIWCQYSIKLKERFRKHFPDCVEVIEKMRGAIPKMHVKSHQLLCQLLMAFNYLRYSGETWGENIESGWAEQNQTAGSTKEQNDGHQHDTLDDVISFWNWMKQHQLCECYLFTVISKSAFSNVLLPDATLSRMYVNCIQTMQSREEIFQKYSARFSSEIIQT